MKPAAAAAAVTVLAAVLYLPSTGGDFVWDDRAVIVKNDAIASLGGIPRLFARPIAALGYFRPLVMTSHAVERAVYGVEPFGYHLTNVLLHAVATLGVFVLARRLHAGADAWPTALLAAGLFAVLPVHAENVCWVSARHDLLAAAGAIYALAAYVTARSRERTSRPWLAAAAGLFLLALYGKETAAALPVVALAWEWSRPAAARRGWLRSAAVLGATLLAYMVHRRLASGPGTLVAAPDAAVTAVADFLTALPVYLRWCLLPYELNAYHQHAPASGPADPRLWLGLLLAAAVVVLVRRVTAARLPIAGFLGFLLPVSGVLPVKHPEDVAYLVAERWLYLPSVFLCIGLALVVRTAALRLPRIAVVGAVAALAVYWTAVTLDRQGDWRDDVTLWSVTEQRTPGSWHVAYNLGRVLYETDKQAAVDAFQRSIDVAVREGQPPYPAAWFNRAVALIELKRWDAAASDLRSYLSSGHPVRRPMAAVLLRQVEQRLESHRR